MVLEPYVPDPEARLHPDASPLRSANFADLPPAVILTAEHDVLRDEGGTVRHAAGEGGRPGAPPAVRRADARLLHHGGRAARGGGGPGLRGGGHRRAAESKRPAARIRTQALTGS